MGLFSKKQTTQQEDGVLTVNDIYTGLPSTDKWQAICLAGEKLLQKGCVEEPYIQAMVEREKVVTTFLGEGVAIPHGVGAAKGYVKKTGLVVLQYPEGIAFDGGKAHLLIGIAALEDAHLPILAGVANIMMQEELIQKLLLSTDPKFIYDCFMENIEEE